MKVLGSDREKTHLDLAVKPPRVRGGDGSGGAGLARNVEAVSPAEFAQVKKDVGRILDLLEPKNGGSLGSGPNGGSAPPNVHTPPSVVVSGAPPGTIPGACV